MATFLETALNILGGGESIVIASIVAQSGSAPRGEGSKMILRQDGSILGSIGGGRVEGIVMESAKELFATKRGRLKFYALTQDEVAGIGMACGGDVTVYTEYLDAGDEENMDALARAVAGQAKGRRAWLVTRMDAEGGAHLGVYTPEVGIHTDWPEEVVLACGVKNRMLQVGEETFFIERLTGLDRAFVFGGGHIGQSLVPMLASLGFYTVIIDDRAEFCSPDRFPAADEWVQGFSEEVFRQLPFDERSYVVVITRGHAFDKDVLRLALQYAPEAAYIGMIGSKSKRFGIYDDLLAEGFTYGQLHSVYAPIGLPIGAKTPEEIAVCIAAEMIDVRAKKNG